MDVIGLMDAKMSAKQKYLRMKREIQEKFNQPLTDARASFALSRAVRPLDPNAADKIVDLFGGTNGTDR